MSNTAAKVRIEDELPELTPLSAPTVAGVSRYEASVAINRATASDAEGTLHYLATGTDFADALSGAVLAAVQRAPLSLVQPTCVPAPAAAMLGEQGPTSVVLIGGPGALGAGVAGLTGCG